MADRYRDFGSGAKTTAVEPVVFRIRGQQFNCVPMVSGHSILAFMRETGSRNGQVAADGILKFLKEALTDDSYKEFVILSESKDPEDNIDLQELLELCAWLVEEYSERPIQPPSKSSSGRKPAGRSSTAGSSRQAATV